MLTEQIQCFNSTLFLVYLIINLSNLFLFSLFHSLFTSFIFSSFSYLHSRSNDRTASVWFFDGTRFSQFGEHSLHALFLLLINQHVQVTRLGTGRYSEQMKKLLEKLLEDSVYGELAYKSFIETKFKNIVSYLKIQDVIY